MKIKLTCKVIHTNSAFRETIFAVQAKSVTEKKILKHFNLLLLLNYKNFSGPLVLCLAVSYLFFIDAIRAMRRKLLNMDSVDNWKLKS